MQIFRPFPDHTQSARYLCDSRLNKQTLEASQIIRLCLAGIGAINANTRYLSHPVVQHVYNGGRPYLLDMLRYMSACDAEFQRRGGNRGAKFAKDMADLYDIVAYNIWRSDDGPLPPYFVSGSERISGPEAYSAYRRLLGAKWAEEAEAGVKVKANLARR